MENKVKLVDASVAEQEAFKKGLDELLASLSLKLSQNIIKKTVSVKLDDGTVEMGFMDCPILALHKIVEEVEAEKIVSPLSEELTGNAATPQA